MLSACERCADWHHGWHSPDYELCPDYFSLPLAHSQQLFFHYFSLPFYALLSPVLLPFFPHLPISLIMAFLHPSSILPLSSPFPSFFLLFPFSFPDLFSPSFPSYILAPSPRSPPDGEAAAPCCRLRAVVPGTDGWAGDRPRCSLPSLLPPASACQSFPSAAGNSFLYCPSLPCSCSSLFWVPFCQSIHYTCHLM